MRLKNKIKILPLIILTLALPVFTLAEELADTCKRISETSTSCDGLNSSDCKVILEKCAIYYEQESQKIAEDLTKTEQEKKTLQSQVSSLKKKVQNLTYQINQGNVIIKDIGFQIGDTQNSIDKTSLNIEEAEGQITSILRSMYEEDQKSSIEILLEGNLSDFFDNLVYLEGLNSKVADLLDSTRNLKSYLENQKVKMDDERNQLQRTVKVQTLQKQESEKIKKEQEGYLKITEAQYQKQLLEKQEAEKKAAAIRSRIFELLGVAQAPSFGQAYEIAKYASGLTGVRPALILAVITQESNLGKNVGQCYLKNTQTGAGVKIKTGVSSPRTMNPKTIPYFLEVIKNINERKGLIRNPLETPVSCVMYSNGVPYGYGGAMGPGQFIASTWKIYDSKVEAITGRVADPWDIKDAFLATALYLKDSGGDKKSGEFKATMNYFSGSSWTKWEEFYGRSVLSIATGYEKDITAIGG
ncbi:MAG: lytic murein transglycosylase [Candidatus Staskawiczbacteria bacterium]|nr:lytic murein transglycosylase [Candidatus Staskawiczbacteria bacterium]